jgi:hypothetical protein
VSSKSLNAASCTSIVFVMLCFFAAFDRAIACACCADAGSRVVTVEKLDAPRLDKIDQLRFGKTAELFVGEGDVNAVKGIASASEHYDLEVARQRDGLIFAFRDKAGRVGTLILHMPTVISVFEIDPRDGQQQEGGGVRLYKEWKLSSIMKGTGIFRVPNATNQFITLILQGRGNFCSEFTHWTLVINGPVADYLLFGDLIPPN